MGRWSFFHDSLSVQHQGQGDIPQQCSETCLHTCDIEGKRQLHAPFLTERNGNYNTRSFDHHGKQTIIGSSKKVYCYDVIIFLEYIKKFFRIFLEYTKKFIRRESICSLYIIYVMP